MLLISKTRLGLAVLSHGICSNISASQCICPRLEGTKQMVGNAEKRHCIYTKDFVISSPNLM